MTYLTAVVGALLTISTSAQTPTTKALQVASVTIESPTTLRLVSPSGDVLIVTSKTPIATAPDKPSPSPDGVIRGKCAKDWPDDFRMRAVCEKQQIAAVGTLNARPMLGGDLSVIRQKCATDWADDFHMRNVCEEQQMKALKELGR